MNMLFKFVLFGQFNFYLSKLLWVSPLRKKSCKFFYISELQAISAYVYIKLGCTNNLFFKFIVLIIQNQAVSQWLVLITYELNFFFFSY